MSLVRIARQLVTDLSVMNFGAPVTHVYNPLEYAWEAHRAHLDRYGKGPKRVMMIGMNPGPWGMAQTGVPFGEVAMVRDWLGIETAVAKPKLEHPKRPIEGFACKRSEVSGSRLWGWVRETFERPETFFESFFIANYCPLVFMEESGKNRTPDKLPPREREPLLAACDKALRKSVQAIEPEYVIGVGAWAELRAQEALEGLPVKVGRILHPSPASPLANQNWAGSAAKAMKEMGIQLP